MAKDLRDYQQRASDAAKPGQKPGPQDAKSGAARSSYEETTFGMNSGSGPNASRDEHKKPGRK